MVLTHGVVVCAVTQVPGVVSVKAVQRRVHGREVLVVFVTPADIDAVVLKNTVALSLDAYLCPDHVVPVSHLPSDIDPAMLSALESSGFRAREIEAKHKVHTSLRLSRMEVERRTDAAGGKVELRIGLTR